MKNTYLTFVLIALCNILFAQVNLVELDENYQDLKSKDLRSAWVGGGFNYYYTGAVAGDEFYIAGSEFEQISIGDKITKVKFYHILGTVNLSSGNVTFDNSSYTIKIYENPVLGGPYSMFGFYNIQIGSPVYEQTIVLDNRQNDQFYELELTEPYIVNENDFWVAVCFDNGKGAMRLGEENPESEGKYFMYLDGSAYGAGTVIGKVNFGSISEASYCPLGISLYIDDENPYEEQSDLTIKYLDTYPNPNDDINTLSIDDNQNLIIYPVIKNNGLDATSDFATISATIAGESLVSDLNIDLSNYNALAPNYYTTIYSGGALTISVAELDNMGISGMFDICFTVDYNGIDPVSSNNTACITVTRGEIAETDCDIQALFLSSNTDFTPLPSEINIGTTEDFTIFPAVKNNGPDDANNTAAISITVEGIPVDNQTINLTGLLSGETMPVTDEGYTVNAALMDSFNLTEFEICMTANYAGLDNNIANNKICATITRSTVGISEINKQSISIFPNPASDYINIKNLNNERIYILNSLGEIVKSVDNQNNNQIDISDLANGTYFIRINEKVVKFNVLK